MIYIYIYRRNNRAYGQTEHNVTDPPRDSELGDYVLNLIRSLVAKEFEDSKSSSTLLVYFSGILGISTDGLTFERALNYTPKLSGMIYYIRLVFLELVLPRFRHDAIGWQVRLLRG